MREPAIEKFGEGIEIRRFVNGLGHRKWEIWRNEKPPRSNWYSDRCYLESELPRLRKRAKELVENTVQTRKFNDWNLDS